MPRLLPARFSFIESLEMDVCLLKKFFMAGNQPNSQFADSLIKNEEMIKMKSPVILRNCHSIVRFVVVSKILNAVSKGASYVRWNGMNIK